MYRIVIMSQAQKDAKKISASGLKPKAAKLLEMIQHDPFCYPPAYEYLKGDLKGLISRR
jgi:Txe/YoeB family toxin of toxin-antitoxin system